jgi:lysophospholipase L1-like esterase
MNGPSDPRARAPSVLANLLLVLGSVAAALLFLGVAEGGLRLAGIGDPDVSRSSRLKYQQIYLPVFEEATTRDGALVRRVADARLAYDAFLDRKEPQSIRVFVFGGSAAAGLGFSPNASFAGFLERMLRDAHPDATVEVVNLGMVALASRQVKILVEDVCRRYEPDAVVVYSGNNEFLEVHAEAYFEATASWWRRIGDGLMGSNFYRSLSRAVRGPPRTPSLAELEFSGDDLRRSAEETLTEQIELEVDDIGEVVERYRNHLAEIADVAAESDVPLVLMTVASNWRWRGRHDLPPGWIVELVGGAGEEPSAEGLREARRILSERLEGARGSARHEALYRRAVVSERLGELGAARSDYAAAVDADPHLRRALTSMNGRVRTLAQERGVSLVDTVEVLSTQAKSGIIGFDEFFDYVHFTPRGALLVAAALYRALEQAGVTAPAEDFDAGAFVADELVRLGNRERDALRLEDWVGFGFDPDRIADRDLWKYDRMIQSLDRRLETEPHDVTARVYRGNAHYFRVGGGAAAEADYRAALESGGGSPEIQANLERVLAEERP